MKHPKPLPPKPYTPNVPLHLPYAKPWFERQWRRRFRDMAENERCHQILWSFEMDQRHALWKLHKDLEAIGVESGFSFPWFET